jgi:hypothetical protein
MNQSKKTFSKAVTWATWGKSKKLIVRNYAKACRLDAVSIKFAGFFQDVRQTGNSVIYY